MWYGYEVECPGCRSSVQTTSAQIVPLGVPSASSAAPLEVEPARRHGPVLGRYGA